jgi:16S rRNA processing protein RimM
VTGDARLEIGRIGRAHGLRGDVGVKLTTERLERLAPGSVLHAGDRPLVVTDARLHSGRWLVRFEGIDDRGAAESLNGLVLSGDPLPTGDDELWVHELIGRPVRDRQGRDLGHITSVEANPASDLLVVDDDVLIPMTFVIEQGPDGVVVDPPDGLLDVNRRD